MIKNFITKLKDTFREFKKRDIIICTVAVAAILIGVCIFSIKKPADNPTFSPETPEETVPTSAIEQKLENILAKINGAGNVDVLITYKDASVNTSVNSQTIPTPLGAVVLADGADDLEVRIQIQQAVQTALGIEANQVKIFKTGNTSVNG